MDYPIFTHAFCIHLRDRGFPQPELSENQIWYNLLGYASYIGFETMSGKLQATVIHVPQQKEVSTTPLDKKMYIGKQPTEGMVYHPTFREVVSFLSNKPGLF